MSERLDDRPHGLVGTFRIKDGPIGDTVLDDVRNNFYGGLSVEFHSLARSRAADGVMEVRAAQLLAVALVCTPAYADAMLQTPELVATRNAQFRIPPRPVVDLTPVVITNQWGNLQRLA